MQGQENTEGGARAGGSGGSYRGEVWHPSWALKNEEVVERQGQWGRHLAEGTARAKAERREIAWRAETSAIKLQPRWGRGGDSAP